MLDYTKLKVGEYDVRLSKDAHGTVVDIEILLDTDKRSNFLKHFDQQDRHWTTSSYSYILHNELAKYRKSQIGELPKNDTRELLNLLQECTTHFANLERFINNPPSPDRQESLADLETAVENYKTKIQTLLTHYKDTMLLPVDRPAFEALFARMEEQVTTFKGNVTALKNRVPTTRQLRKLFSVQNESPDIESLGAFVAGQMQELLGAGIKRLYEITGHRFKQLFLMDPAIKALSDAKSAIELKSSLYGIRYNNSHAPIPEEMLDVISPRILGSVRPARARRTRGGTNDGKTDGNAVIGATTAMSAADATTADSKTDARTAAAADEKGAAAPSLTTANLIDPKTKKWFSIRPYASLHDLQEVDQVLCYLNQCKPKDRKTSGAGSVVIILLANIAELILTPLRLIASAFSFVVDFFTWGKVNTHKFDLFVAGLHHAGSLVRLAKNKSNSYHYRTQTGLSGDDPHQKILDELKNNTHSLYNTLVTNYASGHVIAEFLRNTLRKIWSALSNLYHETSYIKNLGGANQAKRQELFDKVKAKINDAYQVKLAAAIRDFKGDENSSPDLGMGGSKLKGAPLLAGQPQTSYNAAADAKPEHPKWETVRPWQANEYTSVWDFLDEIFVGLSDLVIDPMFRKSPGAATFFFMLSNASLAAMIIPALGASPAFS